MRAPLTLRIAVTDPQETIHYDSVLYDTERDARAAQRAIAAVSRLLERTGAWAVSDVVTDARGREMDR